jgi:hypothetical protein
MKNGPVMNKKIIILATTLLFILPTKLFPQSQLLPIDSLYLNSIEHFYEIAEEHSDEIWPGMEIAPIILYRIDGPAFLYNHPCPPESFTKHSNNLYIGLQSELQLFGDTITDINGALTAIVNYEHNIYSSPAQTYATLFHELFHAWQRNEFPDLHPGSITDQMTYPEDYKNDALKLFEKHLLFEMSFEKDETRFTELLNRFYTSRMKRKEIIANYTHFEQSLETFEGTAFYTEYRFYETFSEQPDPVKNNYIHNHFWAQLVTPNYGRENLRNRHVASGFAMSRLLEMHHPGWKSEFYRSGKTLFDFFVNKFQPEITELPVLEKEIALSRFHTKNLIAEREQQLLQFYQQPGVKVIMDFETSPEFRGFDPVNAISIDEETVLHKTSLRLGRGDNEMFVQNKDLITETSGQVFIVNRVILFVPEHSIDLNRESIKIDDKEVTIRWKGELIDRENDKIYFRAD